MCDFERNVWCNDALCRTTNLRKIQPGLNLPRLAEDPWGLTGRYTRYYFKICSFYMTFFVLYILCICVWLQKELPKKTDCPHMCAYKLVTVKFKWWGLQNKVENFIQKVSFSCSVKHVYVSNNPLQSQNSFSLLSSV